MSNYYLKLRISGSTPWKAKKELKQYKSKLIFWTEVELMQYKGLRYIPAILYTAAGVAEDPSLYLPSRIGLPLSYFEDVVRVFRELGQKVSIRVVRSRSRGKYALWPNDALSLKEVHARLIGL